MPTYRSINLSLHSQFDIETFPEYPPEAKESYLARAITGFIPDLIDDTTSTCSVYVPVLPGSTFWISYSVEPPVPTGHYFLFKLYINGAHIVSFSTGKEDGWEGKTMFGLFESSESSEDRKRVEKRVLAFTPPDSRDHMWKDVADVHDKTARVEVRVHRANARKRVERVFEEYTKTPHAKHSRGVRLVSAGRAGPEQPKRFYKFALIDPIDQPFATFRYYYRTWDQLRELGLLEPGEAIASEDDNLPVIEPLDTSPTGKRSLSKQLASQQCEDVFLDRSHDSITQDAGSKPACIKASTADAVAPPRRSSIRIVDANGIAGLLTMGTSVRRASKTSNQPRTYIPSGTPEVDKSSPDMHAEKRNNSNNETASQRSSSVSTPPHFYRLSIPPSIRLAPPDAASAPCPVPACRSESASSTAYRPHPAFAVDEWKKRTPSPVRGVRESITTPPMVKASERAGLMFRKMLPAAWRRRTVSGPSAASPATGRVGARSAT